MKRKEEIEELLVVVDMVNGFIKEGVMSSKNIAHIIPRIKALVEKTKESNESNESQRSKSFKISKKARFMKFIVNEESV